MPEFVPRIGSLFFSGFRHIALYMAYLYAGLRLLPANHPYLRPENIGRYGIRNVMTEAANNLVFDKKHADQVLLYFTLLAGIVLLFLQFALFFIALFVPEAHAGFGGYVASFFQTPLPTYDIAFMMLDYVFGIPGLYNSCVALGVPCVPPSGLSWSIPTVIPAFPSAVHEAMHLLVEFYNTGILVVGLIILLYFVVTIVAETAVTGTPFGKRFNRLWFPLRLIFAVALLVPMLNGFNLAQVMTLRVAKWGSSLATNGWNQYSAVLAGTSLLGDPNTLVATPNSPEVNSLLEFMFVARACMRAELTMHDKDVRPYLVKDATAPLEFMPTTFANALAYFENSDFLIRFGEIDPNVTANGAAGANPDFYVKEKGYVKPTCGQVVFNIQDIEEPGGLTIQEAYYQLVKDLWTDALNDFYANNIVLRTLPDAGKNPFATVPDRGYVDLTLAFFQGEVDNAINAGVASAITNSKWFTTYNLYGWGGAAIWYNKVAQLNGSIYSSAFSLPKANLYPEIMELIKKQRGQYDHLVSPTTQYAPYLSDEDQIEFRKGSEEYIAIALYQAQRTWLDPTDQEVEDNPFLDTVSLIFGLDGLFSMSDNPNIHPLAQLVGVGRSLMEHTVNALALGTGSAVASRIFDKSGLGTVSKLAADTFFQVAMIGGILGFILFYVIPFMPFIYFFFALGGWIKCIFEAVVAMPLFALAHVRIDGEGLPGPVAMNGYFLLLEILIRPILIVFGLIAAIMIYAAQVRVLHEIWPLIVSNLAGFDKDSMPAAGTGSIEYLRNEVDMLFHTVLYAIIVYMLGVANFKLVDLIPNFILRWMNAGVSTFGEKTQDPAGSVVRNMFYGSQMVVGQTSGAFMGLLGRNG